MLTSVSEIEKILYENLPKEEGFQKNCIEAMNYAFKAGGKRLRPMMMELSYSMFVEDYESNNKALYKYMSALEMIHTYSLIHDDLPALDNDDLRRGLPTVHKKYGEDVAILAGDGLLNYAYEVASGAFDDTSDLYSAAEAMKVLTAKPGIYGMVGGQVHDVEMSGRGLTSDGLFFIYENKTAALIECALMIGAILAGANKETIQILERIGSNVGIAFQIQDDILDLVGDEAVLGKPINSDVDNDKTTYISLHGLDAAKSKVKELSEEAINELSELKVTNSEALNTLKDLFIKLIDRDR